jgi:hypothetical protein
MTETDWALIAFAGFIALEWLWVTYLKQRWRDR